MPPLRRRFTTLTSPIIARKPRVLRPTVCQNCGCHREGTTLWRSNPDAKTVESAGDNVLCNACGLYRNEHGHQRPVKYWSRSSPASDALPDDEEASSVEEPALTCPSPLAKKRPSAGKGRRNSGSTADPALKHERRRSMIVGEDDIDPADKVEARTEAEEAAKVLLMLRADGDDRARRRGAMRPAVKVRDYRPSWVFNVPSAISVIPPPQGFHDAVPRRVSVTSIVDEMVQDRRSLPRAYSEGYSLASPRNLPLGTSTARPHRAW
ncbi:hypothetical protein IAU60_000344 [Kwoniella sp. DSM 27419]